MPHGSYGPDKEHFSAYCTSVSCTLIVQQAPSLLFSAWEQFSHFGCLLLPLLTPGALTSADLSTSNAVK